jgi:hypothetical protein
MEKGLGCEKQNFRKWFIKFYNKNEPWDTGLLWGSRALPKSHVAAPRRGKRRFWGGDGRL